jgi:PAS domain S-box-containing protein
MHSVLRRQLRKLDIAEDGSVAPSLSQWRALLARVERTYFDADQDRYTMERAIDLSSEEMRGLHRSLASERDKLRSIFESAALGIVRLDPDGRVLDANAATLAMFDLQPEEIEGRSLAGLFDESDGPGAQGSPLSKGADAVASDRCMVGSERRHRHKDGTFVWIHVTRNWVKTATGDVEFGTAILENVTTRKILEGSLRHAQKLESVGRLAAGVAHEINTPIQFINDNVHFLRTSFETLTKLQAEHDEVVRAAPEEVAARYAEASTAADLEYLAAEIPRAIGEALDGLNRVATIVHSMKSFAHADRGEPAPADINAALMSTLTIARSELKSVAETVTDFGELPPVLCHLGDLNQVFLNLLVNAAQAIGDVVATTGELGVITVRTRSDGPNVIISISDTGGGITEEVRGHLFEPFFTTKAVGQGSGQGLALARAIIVERHAGEITLETAVGRGTTFHVRLPVSSVGEKAARAA